MDTQKAQKLGKLLADSMLADEIKEAIVKNLAIIPMPLIDKLIASLEAEGKYMANAVTDIENFFAEQNNAWDALAARQKKETERIVAEEALKIEIETTAGSNNNRAQ